jgi:folate-binding protein YgfZ
MKNACGRLNHLGLLRIAGPDAAGFLQGQLSNDTRRLTEGRCLLAAYSSAQGRVLALLRLIPHSTGILAIMPRDLVADTLDRLKKFVLRSKVVLEDVSDTIALSGCFGRLPASAGDYAESAGIGRARVSGDAERYWVVGDTGASQPGAEFEDAWRLADIEAGLPQVYPATQELFVAQMLNLDLIDGISFTKGCYTGQEIIARTQHLGRIKRRTFILELPAGSYRPGDALALNDGRTARLVEVVNQATAARALAVLNLEAGAAAETDGAASVDACVTPPPYYRSTTST